MSDPVPRNVKSIKSRLDTINQSDAERKSNVAKVQSHFLVASNKLDKVTRRVIAPYAQIERKGTKDGDVKEGTYLDINRFNIFLEDTVDLDALLYETANVLKTVTNSCGKYLACLRR
ncbi:jg25808 [Pararge aegeria aegeria]|uniref:Jg25808 protein n=1 Tax=Pararge aegeria aegeria TaxID=348720 RepID=A0A8S4S285_9NEOP|nr:jg25808 [Pararge aegeria aegeria]